MVKKGQNYVYILIEWPLVQVIFGLAPSTFKMDGPFLFWIVFLMAGRAFLKN